MKRAFVLLAVALSIFGVLLTIYTLHVEGASPEEPTPLKHAGTVQVTARLVEIPSGAIFQRDLYHYATILKYQVLSVQRGSVETNTIFVAHYDPWKPRKEAPDRNVRDIGGDTRRFQTGRTYDLALSAPLDDYYTGPLVNKYFGQTTGTLYWAVWTSDH